MVYSLNNIVRMFSCWSQRYDFICGLIEVIFCFCHNLLFRALFIMWWAVNYVSTDMEILPDELIVFRRNPSLHIKIVLGVPLSHFVSLRPFSSTIELFQNIGSWFFRKIWHVEFLLRYSPMLDFIIFLMFCSFYSFWCVTEMKIKFVKLQCKQGKLT